MNSDDRVKNLLESTAKGEDARKILESSAFIDNFDIILEGLITDLKRVDATDSNKVQVAVIRYQEACKFKDRLTVLMQDGERDKSVLNKLMNSIKR